MALTPWCFQKQISSKAQKKPELKKVAPGFEEARGYKPTVRTVGMQVPSSTVARISKPSV